MSIKCMHVHEEYLLLLAILNFVMDFDFSPPEHMYIIFSKDFTPGFVIPIVFFFLPT